MNMHMTTDTDKENTTPTRNASTWLNKVKWDEQGLVPVIAQEAHSNDVLMFAWMNRTALAMTVELGEAVYWSRSRKKLWHKGEESGNIQKVLEIRIDCDQDVVLLKIEQGGGVACHTGRRSCFFQKLDPVLGWQATEPVLMDPAAMYADASKADAARTDASKTPSSTTGLKK
jgi:phosphoribosyl-AMP cyclohydrolase